ncbi:MAG TPA: glycerophosphodiester phosphodiesterase family protein [Candidatus Saccharimonadales bacterium]
MRRRAEDYPFFDIPGPIAIAHRGGNLAGMENQNTMEAFESAQKAGLVYVETDVVSSKDEKAIVLHILDWWIDAWLSKEEWRRPIQRQTHSNIIKRLVDKGRGEPPLLEQALSDLPNLRFFIDPKTDRAVEPVANAIKSQRAEDRVCIGSFNSRRILHAAELLDHKVSTSFLKHRAFLLRKAGVRLERILENTEVNSLQIVHNLIQKATVEQLQESGIKVIAWPKKGHPEEPRAYDTPEYIEAALDAGLHGLMSDHTEEMKKAVLTRDPDNRSIRR